MFLKFKTAMRVGKNHIVLAMLCSVLLSVGDISRADDTLELEADRASYDNKTGVAIYHGNVRISQGNIVLKGDVVEVHTIDDEVSKLIATANPSRLIRQDEQHAIEAEAQRIEYRMAQGIVDFLGKVRIKEAGKLLTGDHATYDIRKKTVNMEKKENRVKLIIQPKTKTP